jgi:predicted patatin/cPLA2 family phospholipase
MARQSFFTRINIEEPCSEALRAARGAGHDGAPIGAGLIVLYTGDLEALRRLYENEEAIRAGHTAPHRILVIGTGGGMCCIRAAAYLTAWRDAGLARAVDHAITVSGSGGAIGAFLSGMPHRAIQMFEHLAVSGFVTDGMLLRRRLRLSHLADVLRGRLNPIAFNQTSICAHRTSWHVVVTRLTGESYLLDAKLARPDAAQAVLASSAFPHMAEPIRVGVGEHEENLVDGACGMPLPILAGVKRFRPDTLIVLASRPLPRHLPWFEQWLWPTFARTMLRHMPAGLRKSAAAMSRAMLAESDRLERLKRISWCRITPDGAKVAIKPWTTDLRLLRKASDEAKCFMRDALRMARPARQV